MRQASIATTQRPALDQRIPRHLVPRRPDARRLLRHRWAVAGRSDLVHLVPGTPPRLATFSTHAGNDHPVACHAESMLPGQLVPQRLQPLVFELEQPVALRAMEMVVLRVSVIVFVDRPPIEDEFPQQPRVHQFPQSAVDGRPAHVSRLPASGTLLHELVGVEMLAAVGWGMGWMIFGAREFLNTEVMLAGVVVIGIMGLALEKLVFQRIEEYTVMRWGMVS